MQKSHVQQVWVSLTISNREDDDWEKKYIGLTVMSQFGCFVEVVSILKQKKSAITVAGVHILLSAYIHFGVDVRGEIQFFFAWYLRVFLQISFVLKYASSLLMSVATLRI